MAERKDIYNSPFSGVSKGMAKDLSPGEQPPGYYQQAWNVVDSDAHGQTNKLVNEKGTELCVDLAGLHIIGRCDLTDDDEVLFLTDGDGDDQIWFLDRDCTKTVLFSDDCLSFSLLHQIDSTFRTVGGCNRNVYFVDGNNLDRYIDVDDILRNPTDHKHKDSDGNDDCSLVKMVRAVEPPCIKLDSVSNSGGSISYGMYSISISYADSDGNPTDWLSPSPWVPIFQGSLGGDYDSLWGGDTGIHTAPSSKSITFRIDNVDPNYSSIRVAIIELVNGVTLGWLVDTLPGASTSGTSVYYTFRGIRENSIEIPVSELIVPRVEYISRFLEQADSHLVKLNVKERDIDYAALQQVANSAYITYGTKDFQASNSEDDHWSSKSPRHYFETRSFPRDEIVAIGLVFILNDGTELRPVHVPGRKKDLNGIGLPISSGVENSKDYPVGNQSAANSNNRHNRAPADNGKWDSTELIVTDNVSMGVELGSNFVDIKDVAHLDLNLGESVERWQVYNTAVNYTPSDPDNYSEGIPGYWESETEYPDDLDCNNDRVYPEGNIRHHRMPDTTLEPHYVGNSRDLNYLGNTVSYSEGRIFPLFIEVHGVGIPAGYTAADFKGWKVVIGEAFEGDKSVLDKGIACINTQGKATNNGTLVEIEYRQSYPAGVDNLMSYYAAPNLGGISNKLQDGDADAVTATPDKKSISYHGHIPKLQGLSMNGTYLKIERILACETITHHDVGHNGHYTQAVECVFDHNYVPKYFQGRSVNRVITHQALVQPNRIVTGSSIGLTGDFVNLTQQESYIFTLQDAIDDALGTQFEPTLSGTNIFMGAGYDYQANVIEKDIAYHVSVKRHVPSAYGGITQIVYRDASMIDGGCIIAVGNSATSNRVWGGSHFISKLGFRKTLNGRSITPTSTNKKRFFRSLLVYWGESEINGELRHSGDLSIVPAGDQGNYYRPTGNSCENGLVEIFWPKDVGPSRGIGVEAFLDYAECHSNYYAYNRDYSRLPLKKYFPLAVNYKYCSGCVESFPYRLVHSRRAFARELEDGYRVFLALAYKDISPNSGEITGSTVFQDNLWIRTANSTYVQPTKDLQGDVSGAVLSVGTGEFLSLPEKEVFSSDETSIGTRASWATKTSIAGLVLLDEVRGKIYLSNGEAPEDITGEGSYMEEEFRKRFPSTYREEFYTITGVTYVDNPANPNGTGYQCTYDSQNDRLIFTIKDYSFLVNNVKYGKVSDFPSSAVKPTRYIISDGTESSYKKYRLYEDVFGRGIEAIELTDSDYFENLSYTISYNLKRKAWLGNHSYLPDYIYSRRAKPMTSIGSKLYKHLGGAYGSFYGTTYDCIWEVSIPYGVYNERVFSDITYVADVFDDSLATKEDLFVEEDTFDKVVIYNRDQCSGELTIVSKPSSGVFSRVTASNIQAVADKADGRWNLNKFYDYYDSATLSFFTQQWASISGSYPIDKLINSGTINTAKGAFNRKDFRGKYIVVRFFFNNSTGYKIIIGGIKSLSTIALR